MKYYYNFINNKNESVMNGEMKEEEFKKILSKGNNFKYNNADFKRVSKWTNNYKDFILYSYLYSITYNNNTYKMFIGAEKEF